MRQSDASQTMSRYKGRASAKLVEQDYPHFVDITVRAGGLGSRLNAMYEFHTRRGIEARRGQWRRDANGATIRWCFADGAIASEFEREFK